MAIELIPEGNAFVLRQTDSGAEMPLSEDDVLTLAQSAQILAEHIVAKHTPRGKVGHPVVSIPAPKFRLNYDPLHGDLLLDLAQPNGREHHFAMPVATARALETELHRLVPIATATIAKPDQQKH